LLFQHNLKTKSYFHFEILSCKYCTKHTSFFSLMEISKAIFWCRKHIGQKRFPFMKHIKVKASLYQYNWINVNRNIKSNYQATLSSYQKDEICHRNILTWVVKLCSIFYINVISSSSRYNKNYVSTYVSIYVYQNTFSASSSARASYKKNKIIAAWWPQVRNKRWI